MRERAKKKTVLWDLRPGGGTDIYILLTHLKLYFHIFSTLTLQ